MTTTSALRRPTYTCSRWPLRSHISLPLLLIPLLVPHFGHGYPEGSHPSRQAGRVEGRRGPYPQARPQRASRQGRRYGPEPRRLEDQGFRLLRPELPLHLGHGRLGHH